MRRLLAACLLLLALPAAAAEARRVQLGLAGRPDAAEFRQATGRDPDVFQTFLGWNGSLYYAFDRAHKFGAVPMVHLSTYGGPGTPERLTPRDIALGRGDEWLVALQAAIAAEGGPVHVRVMGEMNCYWNPYSAYGAGGRRDRAHSTAWFRQAWRRIAIILRGRRVNGQLRRLRLPPLREPERLAYARPLLMWTPQVAGAPDVPGNAPRAYWPGARYVDWVGTDFYSKFPNFAGLERFYRAFPGKPFAFGEWAMWGRDDPAFVARFFAWMRAHRRARMVVYNQGHTAGGPFDLAHYPRAAAALRRATR